MARFFDGGTDSISYGDTGKISGAGALMTICAWIKFTATQSNRPIIAKWDGAELSYVLLIDHLNNNKIRFSIDDGGAFPTAASVSAYNDGAWHFICGQLDGSNVLLDIDGGAESITGSSYTGIDSSTASLTVGDYDPTASSEFEGHIAECAIWDVVLSSNEIKALNGGANISEIRSSRLWHSPIYGDDSPEPDLSGNGFNGTLTDNPVRSSHPPIQMLNDPNAGSMLIEAAAPAGGTTNPLVMGSVNLLRGKVA